MPKGLKRYYGAGYLHFITSSCYQRRSLLGSARRRDLFLNNLEQVRQRYGFVVVGYVVMPEHFHLLMGEPEKGNPSTVMQVLKQRFARQLLRGSRPRHPAQGSLWDERLEPAHIWQRRFYGFVIWSQRKRIEKLRYMHRNPVKGGLVSESPSSVGGAVSAIMLTTNRAQVVVNEQRPAQLTMRSPHPEAKRPDRRVG